MRPVRAWSLIVFATMGIACVATVACLFYASAAKRTSVSVEARRLIGKVIPAITPVKTHRGKG